jgi:uncharacterized membrane protein HdeD (DUF308 family)
MYDATNQHNKSSIEELPRKWLWMLVLGLTMAVGGIYGLYKSFFMTILTVLFFGYLLLISGSFQFIHFLLQKEKSWSGKIQHCINAIIYIITGAIIIYNPFSASAAITLFIAMILLILGIIKLQYAFQKKKNGWKWINHAIAGVIDIIFTIILITKWPISGLYTIGIFVSIELLINAYFLITTALIVRKLKYQQ